MTKDSLRSPLLVRARETRNGEIVALSPDDSALQYIRFRVVRMSAEQKLQGATGEDEVAIVLVGGTVDVASSAGTWLGVGKRPDPFSGPPEAVYLPRAASYEILARSDVEIAICAAPARESHEARSSPRPPMPNTSRDGQAQRRIRNILMNEDEASTLFLTEVRRFPAPVELSPHKHDEDNFPTKPSLKSSTTIALGPRRDLPFSASIRRTEYSMRP